MTYADTLAPWAVFSCAVLPATLVRRFRTRKDAEEYLRILRNHSEGKNFEVVFDPVG